MFLQTKRRRIKNVKGENMISEKDKEILESIGFKRSKRGAGDCLSGEVYEYDPCITVMGDHATDYATVRYSEDPNVNGLCYYSSAFESLLWSYDVDVNRMVNDVSRGLDITIKFAFVGGMPFLYYKHKPGARTREILGEFLKLIGVLDYVVQRKFRRLDKLNGREPRC